MALVKINNVPSASIYLRVPLSIKTEILALRKLADKHDVDLGATLNEALEQTLREIRREIEALEKRPLAHLNGQKSEG
jgi:hypothetical protein